jgi:hypothetical protein
MAYKLLAKQALSLMTEGKNDEAKKLLEDYKTSLESLESDKSFEIIGKVEESVEISKVDDEFEKLITEAYEKHLKEFYVEYQKMRDDSINKYELQIAELKEKHKTYIPALEKSYYNSIELYNIDKVEVIKNAKDIFTNIENLLINNKEEAYTKLYAIEQKTPYLFKVLYMKYKFDDFLYYIIKDNSRYVKIEHFINKYGMNINHLDENGQTFVSRLLKHKSEQFYYKIQHLIANLIDLDIVDKEGHNALYYAKDTSAYSLIEKSMKPCYKCCKK